VTDEDRPRVVSLAPSATATLCALDVTDRLAAVTAHCEFDGAPSVGGWLSPDVEAVAARDPDLVLTADPLQADVRDALLERGHEVHHVEPRTMPAAFDAVESVGRAVGVGGEAAALADDCRERVARIRDAVAERERPVVYCEEWHDPPMAAGNWVPDAVRAAGGAYPFVPDGERSREVARSDVEAARPDHVVLHVCGVGERIDPSVVADRGWDLPALDRGTVHVVPDALFNQPSPRLVDGVEWLASVLHPDAVSGVSPRA
jgi:iron complex transport system substrate-binding protein